MLFCRHLLLIKFNYLENNDIKKKILLFETNIFYFI